MYKPYKVPVTRVFPDIKVPQPRISKVVLLLVRLLVRLYLFLLFGVVKVLHQGDSLYEAFRRALAGESRCIIAFRHPNGGEPQILGWFFLFKLKALAAKKGIRFARKPHALFVYGYEVVRWGGRPARLVMPNVGAMPIHHSKMDSQGMARIYKAITEGTYPVALAPEGQVSYTTDSIPRLEPGAVRIGFHAAQQLADKNINCPVEILPVSIHFQFGWVGKLSMERLLRKIEKYCGFSGKAEGKHPIEERLRKCRDYILKMNEDRYCIKSDDSLSFNERLERVVNAAVENAERMLGIKNEGDFFARLYKIRQVCWDRIFLPSLDNINNMSRVERGIKDIAAGEAWHIARHQELADFGWYFRHPVPTEDSPLHSKVEYVQNLWDFANRTMGGAISGRKNILIRKVIIQSGPVVNLSRRLPEYKENKKAAINESLSELEKAYLYCINEANKSLVKLD